jgi:siroheme synthase
VTLVSGHGELDYDALARATGTLVVFMGLGQLDAIADGLLAHGKDPHTLAAVISSGTLGGRRQVVAPLSAIAAAAAGAEPPALIVIGDVVALAETLAPAGALAQTA